MKVDHLRQSLKQGLGALFGCSELGEYVRIRTPFLYPDGDVIDLFCSAEGKTITISDLAETVGWLRMQSLSPRRSPRQTRLIEETCLNHGLEFHRGTLQARCGPDDDLAAVVTRVGQGAVRVSDLSFAFRTQAIQSVSEDVADLLADQEFGFERAEKRAGRSGHEWTIDFHVRTGRRSSLVQVLSTGNRAAARRISEHVLATWHDLGRLGSGPENLAFVSLFDDTADVWAAEDFRLVEELSVVSRWSRPDEFVELLREAG